MRQQDRLATYVYSDDGQLGSAFQADKTCDAFRAMDAVGSISETAAIGDFMASILFDATDEQLAAREF